MRGRWALIGLLGAISFLSLGVRPGMAQERYVVKPGDSLHKISKKYAVSMEALKKANSLRADAIKPKQILIIPRTGQRQKQEPVKKSPADTESYIVKQGDTLAAIARTAGTSVQEIMKTNRLRSVSLRAGQPLSLSRPAAALVEEEPEELGDAEGSVEPQPLEADSQAEAEPLKKWESPEERSLFVRVVKTFLGAPYRLGGSTIKGIDCSAFVKKIYEVFNIHLPRTVREQLSFGKKVEKDQLEEGDLVFFQTRRGNNGHVGIYIGNNEFVHASTRTKEVKVDSLSTPYFHQRFFKAVRIKELDKEVRL